METARGAPQCSRTVMCTVLALILEESKSQWEEEQGVCFQVRQTCFAKCQTAHFLSSKAHVLFKEANKKAYSAWVSQTSTHLQIRKASTNTETVYGL